MIGDAYFQLRAQIGTSLFSLAKLARDFNARDETIATLQELQAGLREPFHFVALGESGAGKSTLLNVLFDREFAGDPAFTGRTAVFRHGAESRDLPLTEEIVEAERPHIFLRDFTVVDAPGFQSPAATPAILQRFVPSADVVLFIFPAHGEAHAAWDFLAHADARLRSRFVYLVQQADAVPGEALMTNTLAIHDRLRGLLDDARPIFVVSAHTRAGLEKLERFLDSEIICSPARFQKLREICKSADELLFELGAQTRATAELAETKLKVAAERETALTHIRDDVLRELDRDLWSLTQIFEAAQRRGGELLRRRIDQPALWTSRIDWRDNLRREVEDRVGEDILRTVQLAAERGDSALGHAWTAHAALLETCHANDLGAFPEDSTEHVAALERAIRESDPPGVTTDTIVGMYAAARPRYRIPALAFALATPLAVVAWFMGFFPIAAGAALLAFLATAFAPTILRDNLASELRTLMTKRRENVFARVESEMRAEVDRVFTVLRQTIVALTASGLDERAESAPTLTRIVQLAELFDRAIDGLDAFEEHAGSNRPEAPDAD